MSWVEVLAQMAGIAMVVLIVMALRDLFGRAD